MAIFQDLAQFPIASFTGGDWAIGPTAELLTRSISYNTYSASTASFCYNAAQTSDAAGLKVVVHTLINELIRKGIINGNSN